MNLNKYNPAEASKESGQKIVVENTLHFVGDAPKVSAEAINLQDAFNPGIDLGRTIGTFIEASVAGNIAEKTLNILPILVQIYKNLDIQANTAKNSKIESGDPGIIQIAPVIQGILNYLVELNRKLDKLKQEVQKEINDKTSFFSSAPTDLQTKQIIINNASTQLYSAHKDISAIIPRLQEAINGGLTDNRW